MPKPLHHRSLALLSGLAFALSTQASPIVQPELVIIDQYGNNGHFGGALAATDGILAVGSPHDQTDAFQSGKVMIRRNIWIGTPSNPMQTQSALLETLTPGPGVADFTRFGSSLTFAGNYLAVGSPGWRGPLNLSSAGGVYVYRVEHVAVTSGLIQVLQQPDPGIGDNFGMAVHAEGMPWLFTSGGNRFMVGAPGRENETIWGGYDAGAAYIYNRTSNATSFVLGTVIQPTWLANGDEFGASVAMSGPFYVVGAPGWNDDEGAVFIFMYDANVGDLALFHTIEGSSTSSSSRFGSSMSMWNNRLLVGGNGGQGHASLYFLGNNPAQPVVSTVDFEPESWTDITGWGTSVSLDYERAMVGGEGIAAYFVNHPTNVDYTRDAMLDNETWNPEVNDDLGSAVLVYGSTAWAGAPLSDEFDVNDGAVARWDVLGTPNCPADLDFDYDVDVDDLTLLLNNFGQSTPMWGVTGDVNDDGMVNIVDLVQMMTAWGDCGS